MKKPCTPCFSFFEKHLLRKLLPKSCLFFLLLIGFVIKGYAQQYQRVYANSQTSNATVLLASVQNAGNAADGNIQTYSTLNIGVGLLGLVYASQNMEFSGADQPSANTPVTVKIGASGGLLSVLGHIHIQATLNGTPVGTALDSAALANLLGGTNQAEITFTPGTAYNGVQVYFSSTLGIAISMQVYGAFFQKPATGICSATPIDYLTGVGKYISSVDLVNFSGNVTNPANAMDGDENTYATVYAPVGVAAYTQETVIFSSPSQTGDSVRVVVSNPGGLLNLGVLQQRVAILAYNGSTLVDSVAGNSPLLILQLLAGAGNKAVISFKSSGIFDRVQFRVGGLANVLPSMNLYEMEMVAPVPVINIGGIATDTATVCTDSTVTLSVTNPETGTTYTWWDSPAGGNQLGTGTSYKVPSGQPLGMHAYYVQGLRPGCTVASGRAEGVVDVILTPAPVITRPTADTTICKGQTVTLQASSSQKGVTFNWYTVATGGTPIRNSQDTIHLTPDATTTYYAETVLGSCTSATRTAITITVEQAPQAPVLVNDSVAICQGQQVTLQIKNPQTGIKYVWFNNATGGTALDTSTTFTTPALSDTTNYYVEAISGNCTNASSRTNAVVLAGQDPLPPTVLADTVYVNIGDSATFTIVNPDTANDMYRWYDAASAGNLLTMDTSYTTPSLNAAGTYKYYVETASKNRGCTSISRTEVVVIVSGPQATPCYEPNAQISPVKSLLCLLCSVNNPENAVDGDTTTYAAIHGTVSLLATIGQYLIFQHRGKAGDSIRLTLGIPTGLLDLGALNGVRIRFYKHDTATTAPLGITDALLHLRLLQGNNKGTVTITAPADYDRVLIGIGGLATALTELDVYNAEQLIPMPAIKTTDTSVCPGGQVTLSATPAAGTTVVWFDLKGTQVGAGNTYTTSVLNDTTTYYISAMRDGCVNPDREEVIVNVGTPRAPGVVSDSVQVCIGGNAVLQVANPGTNSKYVWYSEATGGTALDTATSYTVNNVLKDTAYYVGIVNPTGCVSTSRTKVSVIANNNIPAPQLVSDTVTATVGQAVTFMVANADTANFTYHWYNATTGGTLLNTGAGYTTPVLGTAGSYTYYVDAQSKSGCLSNSRTEAVAIIADSTNVLCTMANKQQSPVITGLCLLCTVSNPNNAIDGDTTTASNIRGNIGLLGSVGQIVNFQHSGSAGDSVKLLSATNTGLLDAGVLNGVAVQFYKNGDTVSGRIPLNDALLHLRLLQGVNKSTVIITAPVNYDGIEVSIGGLVTAVTSVYLYAAEQLIPMPTVLTSDTTVCPGGQVTLNAAPAAGTTAVWFDSKGNQVGTGNTYTTPVLNDTTAYYISTMRDGCVNPDREEVIVNVGTPTAPGVVSDSVQVCIGGNAVLQVANPDANSKYVWYSAATGGTALDTATSYSVNNVLKDTAYYVGIVNATGCVSTSRTKVNVTASNSTGAPQLLSDTIYVTTGQPATFKIANADTANFAYHWYNAATGGALLYTGAAFTTDTLNTAGSYVYYVDALANGGCISARTKVAAIATPPGSPKNCNVADAQVSPVNTGLCLLCTVVNPNNAVDGDTTTASNVRANIGVAGSVGQLLLFQHPGLAGDSIQLMLSTNTGIVDAGVLNGIAVQFYKGGDTVSSRLPLNNALLHLRLLQGVNKSIVVITAPVNYDGIEVSVGGLVTAVTSLYIYNAAQLIPLPTVDTQQVTICAGDSVTLKAVPVLGTSVVWYATPTGLTPLATGNTFTTPALTDTTIYYVSSIRNDCPNPNRIPVTVNVSPAAGPSDIIVSAPDTVCSGDSVTLIASSKTVTNPVFNWYSDAQLKNKLLAGTTLKAKLASTTTYYVTVMGTGKCENIPGNAARVTITVNPRAKASDITAKGDTVCAGAHTTLHAASSTVTNPVFTWYADSKLTSKLFTGTDYQVNPSVTTTYYITVQGKGVCENAPGNADSVTVAVDTLPQAPVLSGPGAAICSGDSATLNVTNAQSGITYRWYNATTGGNLVTTGATFVTPALAATTTYYAEAAGMGACINAGGRTAITVKVNPRAHASDIDAVGDTICAGSQATLQATNTTISNPVFNWYSDAKLTHKLFTGATYQVSPTTTTTYYVTVMGTGVCENAPDSGQAVTVTVNPVPQAPVVSASSGGIICSNTSDTLTVTNAQSGVTYQWFTTATGGTPVSSGSTFITPALTVTTTYYVEAISNGGCANSSGRTSTTITVHSLPQLPTVNAPNGGICAGDSVSLSVTNAEAGVTYNWYTTMTGGTPVFTGTLFTTPALFTTTTYYLEAAAGACLNTGGRITVTITVNPAPVVPQVSASSATICSLGIDTLSVTNAVAGVTYNWYTTSTGGTPVYTGASFITPLLKATTTYYVEAASAGGCVNTSGRTSVTVTVNPAPDPPAVKVSDVTVCTGAKATFNIENPNAALTYNWYDAVKGGTLVGTGANFTTTSLQANVSYYVEAMSAGGCISSSRTQVTATVVEPPADPAVTIETNPVCPGTPATLTASSSTPGATFQWYDSETNGNLLSTNNPFVTPDLNTSTTYYVAAVNGGGCANTGGRTSATVTVLMQLQTPNVVKDSATLTSITFSWAPVPDANGYEVSTDNGVTWTQPSSGAMGTTDVVTGLQPNQSVTIKVRVVGQSACQNSVAGQATATTLAGQDKIFVPNGFTPNGDGLNDVWLIYGATINKLNVVVYNQFGQKIFESESQQNGWDGTFHGKAQPTGVYVYYLKVTFLDGTTLTKKGSITLIR